LCKRCPGNGNNKKDSDKQDFSAGTQIHCSFILC
jgi:hypothetical protein